MWRRNFSLWNLLLLIGIGLVLAGLYNTWWGSDQTALLPQAAKEPQVPTAPILRDQQPLSAFGIVAQKDLFSPERQGPAGSQVKNQNFLEGHQLLGVIIVGHTRAALISPKTPTPGAKEAEVEVIYRGEQWNGLEVEDISHESVIFRTKEGQKILTFPE